MQRVRVGWCVHIIDDPARGGTPSSLDRKRAAEFAEDDLAVEGEGSAVAFNRSRVDTRFSNERSRSRQGGRRTRAAKWSLPAIAWCWRVM